VGCEEGECVREKINELLLQKDRTKQLNNKHTRSPPTRICFRPINRTHGVDFFPVNDVRAVCDRSRAIQKSRSVCEYSFVSQLPVKVVRDLHSLLSRTVAAVRSFRNSIGTRSLLLFFFF
jgi:hypothetical protein